MTDRGTAEPPLGGGGAAALSEELVSGPAALRIDVRGGGGREHVLDETTFLGYRLAEVGVRSEVAKDRPDVIWDADAAEKAIRYRDGQLLLDGPWAQGELNKIVVSMLALQMEQAGLHPFHSSAVRYRDRTILFLGGESNHGKSMSQIEGCRRGGLLVSTETTVTDDDGVVVMGSKNVFLRMRAKGTERSDIPDQDEGVAKFFDETPEFVPFEEPAPVDLVVMPGIDGHFDTKVTPMIPFEREYQTFHSLMSYFGLNQLLSTGGIVMPIVDTDELRAKRGEFCSRFAAGRPYYVIRAATPRALFDEVEKLI
jgi:hypothetical protein